MESQYSSFQPVLVINQNVLEASEPQATESTAPLLPFCMEPFKNGLPK